MKYLPIIQLILLASSLAHASDSSFGKIDNGAVSVEVPKNWTFLDSNMKNHINSFSEAVAKANNINLNQGNNFILVAANAYTSSSKPAATLRVSIRPGKFPSQKEMKQLTQLSKSDLKEVFDPAIAETKKALLSVEGVKNVKAVDSRIIQSKKLTCIFTEFETETTDGVKLSQTYMCPSGNNNVKLSTSYCKSEIQMFKPILEYVWNSLSIK